MLASVLNSDRAIAVNLQIVRVYTKMRHLIEIHSEILREIDKLQKNDAEQDQQIRSSLHFEYYCIQFHLLYHGSQAVGAGGRKMFFQTYPVNKIQVCGLDRIGSLA